MVLQCMSDKRILDRNYSYHLDSATSASWAYIDNLFSDAECEQIIQQGLLLPRIASYVGDTRDIVNSIRRNHVVFFNSTQPELAWVFDKMANAVRGLNKQFWRYDLDFIETLQFTIYDQPGDFYTAHMDMSHGKQEQRKLSVVVQLADPSSYEGSNLELHSCGLEFYPTRRNRGSMIAFPSYMVHRVTELIGGTRYSLVGWVIGPPYK